LKGEDVDWAERAKTVGYPERFAQEALGHNQQGRQSRLRQTRPDENSILGRLRATRSGQGRIAGVNAATLQISDPAPLIFDYQPERHRQVRCIWLC
jgi:hypothetical protein